MQQPLSQHELSRLIGLIYDCALDRDRWPDALRELRLALDFQNASLSLLTLPTGETPLNVMSGVEPYWQERVAQYGADVIELWGGPTLYFSLPQDQPLVLSGVRDRAEWESNRFFVEWGRPQGIRDTLALPLASDLTAVGSIGLGRHNSMGDIGTIEVEMAALLLPHLQRAVAIGRLLDFRAIKSATFEKTLDTLSVGVVLTDADLAILHANAAAQRMLADGHSVRSSRGRLTLPSSVTTRALASVVRRAAEHPAELGRRGTGVPVSGAGMSTTILHVLPLGIGAIPPGIATKAAVAIFVSRAAMPTAAPTEALAALYDLTAAETRVFTAIAVGSTRSQAARALGIEENTIKTHLSHIFLKTGTRRQADLVALYASLSLPLVAE